MVLTAIPAGRSVYFLKSSIGDVYPVYIYKQTTEAAADSSVLYVDDDIGNAEGTVAFYNGTDVTFITSGTNGFSTVAAAVEKANTMNGSTVYFAPGHYSVNTTANEVIFTKDVTLLGNNHDVSAVEIKTPNWAQAGRRAESVIDGSFVFEAKGDISVTVKGFTLEGTSVQGPIYINDPSSGAATRAKHLQTVDIQNNIITGSGNGQGSIPATVKAYSGAMVTGVVKNNYFRCTANQFAITNGYTRATAFKNANELTLEGNFFIGYEVVNVFTGHVSDAVAGYCRYSVVSNRFEHCGTSRNYVKGITADTSAYILYNNNDFVRSGGSGYDTNYAVDFIFDENALPNDFSNIKISVLRNNFYDCFRSLQFSRIANTKQIGNMAEMVLKVKANNFIQPTEGKWSKHFHSIRFSFLVDTTYTHNVSVPDTMWDFSQNTFQSKYLDMEDLPGEDATNPAFNYVYSKVTYNGVSGESFELTAKHFN